MQTTLNKIKLHSPCENGWKKLLGHLNKTQSDDEPLELRTILESNGLNDTIWALRVLEGMDKEIRLFAIDCAEMVLPIYEKEYPDDKRPRLAINAARNYANGLITLEELTAAWAAWAAAWSAARTAAWSAAWSAEAACAACAARAASDEGTAAWAARAAWDAWDAWAARAASDEGTAAWDEIKQLILKYI